MAAPAEMRTLNLHRATNRSLRVRMEAWLQYGLGRAMKGTFDPCGSSVREKSLDSDRPSHGRDFHLLPSGISPKPSKPVTTANSFILTTFRNGSIIAVP
jgi:hypothetical protein